LKAAGFELGPDLEITFYLSMPKSWSKKKKSLLEQQYEGLKKSSPTGKLKSKYSV
jgi:hypothetical protein